MIDIIIPRSAANAAIVVITWVALGVLFSLLAMLGEDIERDGTLFCWVVGFGMSTLVFAGVALIGLLAGNVNLQVV